MRNNKTSIVNKGILFIIKTVVTLIIIVFMVILKEVGVPIVVSNLIGLAIIFAVWKYKPEGVKNNDDNQLDKS